MTATYPTCPDCGETLDNRPLFPSATPYVYGVYRDHRGCDRVKWLVQVHPDGEVENVRRVPSHMRLEDMARAV